MSTLISENILADLEAQLSTKPKLLVLGIRDWLAYEKSLKDFAETYMSISMKEDSPVPLTYRDTPVIMKTNEVKELIKELVRANRPAGAVAPSPSSGPVKPMTKEERANEAPEQQRKADLIESLTDNTTWWEGDQAQPTPAPDTAPAPKPIDGIL